MAFLGGIIDVSQRVGPTRGIPPLSSYFSLSVNVPKKVQLTSGDSRGWYVGVGDNWESKRLASRDVPLIFVENIEQAFVCSPKRAEEIKAELNKLGLDSELI